MFAQFLVKGKLKSSLMSIKIAPKYVTHIHASFILNIALKIPGHCHGHILLEKLIFSPTKIF